MVSNDIPSLFSVSGIVACITGGGSGLGLYAARALDANGAKKVYIVGRRAQTLKDAAATAKNGNIVPIVGDVCDKDSLRRITDQIRNEEGFVNLLFANAGIAGPRTRQHIPSLSGEYQGNGGRPSIEEFQGGMLKPSVEDFTQTSHVNVTGVYYTVAAFLDLLDAGNKRGNVPMDSQVLVTSSISGFSRELNVAFGYSTGKAAVNHLVKMLATTFAQQHFRIRANLIAPGLYPSELTTASMNGMEKYEGAGFGDARKMVPDGCPAERTGSEEDFAATVLFMVGKAGAYLNGNCLLSDGGRLSQMPSVY